MSAGMAAGWEAGVDTPLTVQMSTQTATSSATTPATPTKMASRSTRSGDGGGAMAGIGSVSSITMSASRTPLDSAGQWHTAGVRHTIAVDPLD
jgi:hypothetical protein